MSSPPSSSSMKKTVLITGANRGIGLAFCKAYLKRGWNVIATTRDVTKSKELEKLKQHGSGNNLSLVQLDVSDEVAIDNMADNLKNVPIDILINNAGIFENYPDGYEKGSKSKHKFLPFNSSSIMKEFQVNSLGPLLIIRALLPNLLLGNVNREKSKEFFSKIINITSRVGSIGDTSGAESHGYRASKAALNMFTKVLSNDFRQSDYPIAIMALHPGYIATDMTRGGGDMSPDDSVKRMMERIDQLDLTTSGKFIHRDGFELPW